MSDNDQIIIRRFFAAMQAGTTGETVMAALFAEDAIYIEPFSGKPQTHRGKAEILAVFREGWKSPLPDMRIEIDGVIADGDTLLVKWTCYSPALPGGNGRGENRFTISSGKIIRLETRLTFG